MLLRFWYEYLLQNVVFILQFYVVFQTMIVVICEFSYSFPFHSCYFLFHRVNSVCIRKLDFPVDFVFFFIYFFSYFILEYDITYSVTACCFVFSHLTHCLFYFQFCYCDELFVCLYSNTFWLICFLCSLLLVFLYFFLFCDIFNLFFLYLSVLIQVPVCSVCYWSFLCVQYSF